MTSITLERDENLVSDKNMETSEYRFRGLLRRLRFQDAVVLLTTETSPRTSLTVLCTRSMGRNAVATSSGSRF